MTKVTDTSSALQAAGVSGGEFRLPFGARFLSLCACVLLAVASLAAIGACVAAALAGRWALVLGVGIAAAILVELTRHVARDLAGKWGLRIGFGTDALDLALPAGRSLAHRLPAVRRSVPYSRVEAVETRAEAHSSLGMTRMQRPYVLRLAGDERIFLFEERALGTSMETRHFQPAVAEIARRSGASVEDLGMSEEKGGVLGVWGARGARWDAAALPENSQNRLWRRARTTGAVAILVVLAALIARGVFAFAG